MICSNAAAAAIVMPKFAEALFVGELESVTARVNEKVPAVVGIPLICPPLFSVKPAGREPELMDQL